MDDLPLWEVAGILISLGFSALFSASETALTALPPVRIQQILDSGRFWGQPLRLWQAHPNRVLATILIGNNIVNITASALATELTLRIYPDGGVPIAVGVMTFLLLITGEITPKTLARTFPTAVAAPTMAVVAAFYALFFPVTWVLTWMIRGMLKLLGARPDEAAAVTEQDLEYIVRLGATAGTIPQDQGTLLQSVIEFPDTIAKEIMVPRTELVTIPLDSTYEQVVEIAIESGYSRIPVIDGSIDRIVGIFYAKHLLDRPQSDEKQTYLRKRMRPPVFVPESKKISELLKLFQEQGIHMAVVVNEFGGTEGIVTLEDVIEELLGDIRDEFDVEEERLVAMPDGGYRAEARIEIEEIEEELEIEFPEERDYESLGGFLMEAAGTVPAAGWTHEFAGYAFTVTEADANRVLTVEIHKAPPPAEEGGSAPDAAEERSS